MSDLPTVLEPFGCSGFNSAGNWGLPSNTGVQACAATLNSIPASWRLLCCPLKSAVCVAVEVHMLSSSRAQSTISAVLCLGFKCRARRKECTSGLLLWRACSLTARQVGSSKEEHIMSQSRGEVSFEPLFTAEDIGLRKEANVEHVMKVFVTIGEGLASRWIEMPKGVLLLQTVPDNPASGAIYLYDRELQVFYFVVFDEGRDDSLTAAEFDELVTEYNLVSWTAHPALLRRAVGKPGMA